MEQGLEQLFKTKVWDRVWNKVWNKVWNEGLEQGLERNAEMRTRYCSIAKGFDSVPNDKLTPLYNHGNGGQKEEPGEAAKLAYGNEIEGD